MSHSAASRLALGFVPLLCFLASGCSMSNTLEDDPLLVVLLQEAAWNKGDLIGFMAGYHRAPDTTFLSASGMQSGWDAVLERYQKKYPDRASMGRVKFSDLKSRPLGGSDAMLVTGEWRLEREKDPAGGVFTLVMERFDAGWRIVHDHTSAYPPPAPMP